VVDPKRDRNPDQAIGRQDIAVPHHMPNPVAPVFRELLGGLAVEIIIFVICHDPACTG
jgi:hypothetical protein